MKDTVHTNTNVPSAPLEALPAPKGIGMAVAFDWGLAVQILVSPFLPSLLTGASPFIKVNPSSPGGGFIPFLLSLPIAALLVIFGEGVRRGWRWIRLVQIVINTLGFLGGFFTLFNLWQSSHHGNYWPLVTAVILLIFSPLIAWRLSRPDTARWFATASSHEARQRHGGLWPVYIALWAIIGGLLQAMAALAR